MINNGETTMKPRARRYSHKSHCIAWMCEGQKDGQYHVVFSGSWWEACRRWHETKPKHGITDDIPF